MKGRTVFLHVDFAMSVHERSFSNFKERDDFESVRDIGKSTEVLN